MSPEAVTAESVYRSLRVEIFSGRVMAHTVLNLNMIADALGVSVSPVRDAMERLVGERILAIRPGGGFQLPRLGEDGARDLYLWHAFLVRSRRSPSRGLRAGEELLRWIDRVADGDGHGIVAATAEYFNRLGESFDTLEHRLAIRSAGDRLHGLRLRESCLRNRRHELRKLVDLTLSGTGRQLREGLAAYHRRRLRRLPQLVGLVDHRSERHEFDDFSP